MSSMRDPTVHHPSSMSNAMRIIEAVAVLGLGVTAKEIATALHMPPATAYRTLNSLVGEEYLVRTSDLRGFGLGKRLGGLIAAVTTASMSTAALRRLAELRDCVRFAVHVVAFSSGSVRVLDADPDHPLRAERELVRYLHASAAGKLLLAHRTEWRELLPRTPLVKLTPHTITDLAALQDELKTIRNNGFSTQIEELASQLACVAVPLVDADGDTTGALCISGPSTRAEALLSHVAAIRKYAETLSPLIF